MRIAKERRLQEEEDALDEEGRRSRRMLIPGGLASLGANAARFVSLQRGTARFDSLQRGAARLDSLQHTLHSEPGIIES